MPNHVSYIRYKLIVNIEFSELNELLKQTAKSLDIPDHAYEEAIIRYEDIGEFLAEEDSSLHKFNPEIYSQGSFRLGTVVRPIGKGEYDIDLVCRLERKKESVSKKVLKQSIGDRLKERDDISDILKEAKRCWVIEYPDETNIPAFHMDVLPTIPNQEKKPNGILLTDKELSLWMTSNPVDYSLWFMSQMAIRFDERRNQLAADASIEVEDVPNWQVKTPLQRAIQLMKRHRDFYFDTDSDDGVNQDDKPISIIITTLAARAYDNEEDIFETLCNVLDKMPNYILKKDDGNWWVENPVDDGENFADKWRDNPERKTAFDNWLAKAKRDFGSLSKTTTISHSYESIVSFLGESTREGVSLDLDSQSNLLIPKTSQGIPVIPPLGSASHAIDPNRVFTVPDSLQHQATITGSIHRKNRRGNPGRRLRRFFPDSSVPKHVVLKFKVSTNYTDEHSVKWQITNTGQVATHENTLRGDFYDSDEGKYIKHEPTAYLGTHWVRAFIINNGNVCVASTEKFMVRIH